MKLFNIFILIFILTGCVGKTNCDLNRLKNDLNIEISIPQLHKYSIASSITDNDHFIGFVGYNNANHSIDIFKGSYFHKSIKLEFEGPGAIDEIRGVKGFDKDKYILISRNKIRIIEENGGVVEELNISTLTSDSPKGVDLSEYHPYIRPEKGVDFYFDYKSGWLYIPLNNFYFPEWISAEAYQRGKRFIGKINIVSGEFNYVDIDYPEFMANELYGTLSEVKTTFDNQGNMIYGFEGFPNVFVYNFVSEKLVHVPNRNNFEMIPPLYNTSDLFGYSKDKVRYYRLIFNFLDNKLYQVVLRPHPEGGYDTFIRCFNEDFSFKSEGKLEKGISTQSVLIAEAGLYCLDMSTRENNLSYVNFNFICH